MQEGRDVKTEDNASMEGQGQLNVCFQNGI